MRTGFALACLLGLGHKISEAVTHSRSLSLSLIISTRDQWKVRFVRKPGFLKVEGSGVENHRPLLLLKFSIEALPRICKSVNV